MLHHYDVSLLLMVNSLVGRSQFLDHLILSVNDDFSLSGSLLFILLGLVWYRVGAEDVKARLLAGLVATACLTGVSVLLQSVMFVHLRPLFDASLHLTFPARVDPEAWRTIGHPNSFPSDTTTVCAGLAFTIALANRPLGVIALIWTAVVIAFPRVYLTYHYPSDLLGGFALGACVLLLVRTPLFMGPARWAIAKTRHRPQVLEALVLAYLIELSTMFQTVRLALHMLRHHV